eukprot:14331218-Alexandrium_andersonii.AAC.1
MHHESREWCKAACVRVTRRQCAYRGSGESSPKDPKPAPLLGPGVATPGSRTGESLERSCPRILRPRSCGAARSWSGVGC